MKLSNICLVYGPRTRLVRIKEVRPRDLINAVILHREKGERFRGVIGHPPDKMTTTQAEIILAKRQQPSNLTADFVREFGERHFVSRKEELRVVRPAESIIQEYEGGRVIEEIVGHYPDKLTPAEARRIIENRQRVDQKTIERAQADVSQVKLPPENIITLQPKLYEGLGGDKAENNPPHYVDLSGRGEIKLFKLTIRFLRNFASHKLVGEILNSEHNAARQDHELVRGLSIYKILDLLEIINPALGSEMVRLRLPAETLIDVLLDVPEYGKYCTGLGYIPTASYYSSYGVNYNEFEAEMKKGEVDRRLHFVSRTGARHGSGPKVRLEVIPSNRSYMNVALLEVVDVIQPLAALPWGHEAA